MSGAQRRGRTSALRARFRAHVLAAAERVGAGPLVVGVSGGLDSTALLHLLRFTPGLPRLELHVAHVDHGLRAASESDADWVRGMCAAWGVPVSIRRLEGLSGSEEASRNARLTYLEAVRREVGARWVALGHHADDQAETVLHRAVRGAGLTGLAGIPAFREPGLWRPLLPFWREELLAHARAVGLNWREDATNRARSYARNALRLEVMPALEDIAPGARRALVRLGALAEEEAAAWSAALAALEPTLDVRRTDSGVSVDAAAVAGLPAPLRARILRWLAAQLGRSLDGRATGLASDFVAEADSGRRLALTGGLALRRDLDRLSLTRAELPQADETLLIPGATAGEGTVRLGGRTFHVEWGVPRAEPAQDGVVVSQARCPLTVRARRPGDRIRLPYGTKKLKKLLLEARVPEPERGRLPVLVDADGHVLWVPGVARSALCGTDVGPALQIEIDDVEHA